MRIYRLINGKRMQKQVSKDFNFDLNCDILCVGAGCAGVYASIASTFKGANVILVEHENSIGGTHTNGNVHGYYYGFKGGSFNKIDEQATKDYEYFVTHAYKDAKQIAYAKALKQNGVKLLDSHTPIGVYMNENRVVGLQVFNGEKIINISSKILIDATSEGYVLKNFYNRFRFGRPVDNRTAPYSVISNYFAENERRGVNKDAGHVDQYDNQDFSNKLLLSHSDTQQTFKYGDFINVAQVLGVREGISFKGKQTLKYSDVLLEKPPVKPLFYAYSDLDRHGNDRALDQELFQNWWVISNQATVAMPIPMPLGSVVPKGIKGFVTAGRCFSADSYSQSAVRMIRDMFRMGECVGTACAIAIDGGVNFMDIDYDEYLARVKELDCFGNPELGFAFNYPNKPHLCQKIDFDFEKNLDKLNTQTPAPAIWSCFLKRKSARCRNIIFDKMNSANTTLEKFNCAIALGIMNDKQALPLLREIATNRDCFYFTDCRRSNSFRSAVALCLLGRLGNKSDLPLLESIVFDFKETEREIYHTLEPNYIYYKSNDRNFVFYDFWTHASASLVKIYKREKLSLKELNKRFIDLYNKGEIAKFIAPNQKNHQPSKAEIDNFIKQMIKQTS